MYVSLLPVVEACVVVAVPGRVGEVRVAADEPEAVDLDPGVLARRLDAPATVKAVLEQGGRMLLQRGSRRRRGRGCVWSSGSTHPKQNRNSYNQFGLRGKKKSRLIKIHGFLPFSARRCALVPIPVPP